MKPFAASRRDLGEGRCAVEVSGEIDLAVADELKATLDPAMQGNQLVVVDLSECDFIDSTGIAILVTAQKQLAEQGGRLALCSPADQVRRVLDLSGLTNHGLVFDSLDAALSNSQ